MLKNFSIFTIFLSGLFLIVSCSVQEMDQKTGKIYEQVQVSEKAYFEGGNRQLIQFLSSNLEYPKGAVLNNIQGRVIVKFVVEDNGMLTNFTILKDIGAGCAGELIRGLEKTQGRWNSARLHKRRVRSNYILKVDFKIPEDHSQPYLQGDGN